MKFHKFFQSILFGLLVTSFAMPMPAQAAPAASVNGGMKANTARIIVFNMTGGDITVRLQGEVNYYFHSNDGGFLAFNDIQPGKYTITITSSACSGAKVLKDRMIKKIFRTKEIVCRR